MVLRPHGESKVDASLSVATLTSLPLAPSFSLPLE
jgi:hypothetical protein